jgi:single-stranded DNA-specific DHH superfamily exonuclease
VLSYGNGAPKARAIALKTHKLNLCSASQSTRTLLVPDKDADGLSGTLIIYRTLLALGHAAETISVHFVEKGSNPHREEERLKLGAHGAQYAIVVDQGSRPGPSLVPGAKTLLVDHHFSDEFPNDTVVRFITKFGVLDSNA